MNIRLAAAGIAAVGTLGLAACSPAHTHSNVIPAVTSNPAYGSARNTMQVCLKAEGGSFGITKTYECVLAHYPGALSTADQKCLFNAVVADHKLPKGARGTKLANDAGTCVVKNK